MQHISSAMYIGRILKKVIVVLNSNCYEFFEKGLCGWRGEELLLEGEESQPPPSQNEIMAVLQF